MSESIEPRAPLALAPPSVSLAQAVEALQMAGRGFAPGQLSFSIPGPAAQWPSYEPGDEPSFGYEPLNGSQAAAFRAAISVWDRLIAPAIVETNDATSPGTIRIGFTSYPDLAGAAGHSLLPPLAGETGEAWRGDIWIASDRRTSPFEEGGADFKTLVHEIGHALALKHPFEAPALPGAFDNLRFSVMAYETPADVIAVSIEEDPWVLHGLLTPVFPSTPMVLDVAAIQQLYGADPTTAAGDDRYVFDEVRPFLKTIYDAGGNDTLDLSSLSRPSDVDLAPGAYSSIGLFPVSAQMQALGAAYPGTGSFVQEVFAAIPDQFWKPGLGAYTWSDNLGIALSTVIENVLGGSGADTMTGNDAANGLLGGAGADSIRGLNGADWIDGGAGADDVNGNVGSDWVQGGEGADLVRGGRDNDTVLGGDGDDPHVNGNLGDDLVRGDAGADTVFGGQGADTLYGDDGADWLSGDLGDDTLNGGAGADRFLFRPGAGLDWVADFSSAAGDRIQLSRGVAYTVIEHQGQAVVDLGGGARIGLLGVSVAAMGDWLEVA